MKFDLSYQNTLAFSLVVLHKESRARNGLSGALGSGGNLT